MWRYLGPTLIASVLLNIPKFFELCVVQNSDGSYSNNITDLRRNTTYSVIAIWSRLILTGSLPLFVIIFFNFKTYQDVRERRLRTFRRNNFNPSMNPSCCSELKVRISYICAFFAVQLQSTYNKVPMPCRILNLDFRFGHWRRIWHVTSDVRTKCCKLFQSGIEISFCLEQTIETSREWCFSDKLI